MKQKSGFFWLLAGLAFQSFCQTNGRVTDSISGDPIPFVSIWSENQNIGTTSEEDGSFSIATNASSSKLLFSAIGFEKKRVALTDARLVKLRPSALPIEEVVISRRLETKTIEIGKTDNTICQAFDNGPRIDVKYFPYKPSYRQTPYLKTVSLYADSRIEAATIRLHFYAADANGFPGTPLLSKDFIVKVRKGTATNFYDISSLNLTLPQNGLFVGFEKLIIEKNKLEKTKTDPVTQKPITQLTYYPLVLYNRVERPFLYANAGGKWTRKTGEEAGANPGSIRIYEPAINLILSN